MREFSAEDFDTCAALHKREVEPLREAMETFFGEGSCERGTYSGVEAFRFKRALFFANPKILEKAA